MRRRLARAISLLFVFALPGCAGLAGLERPDVVVTRIDPIESQMLEQRMEVGLRLINPNDRDLEVRAISFGLDLNGVRSAQGASGETFVVPRLGDAETSIVASMSEVDLFRQLLVMSERSDMVLTYRLTGRLHLSGMIGVLSFSEVGTLDLAGTAAEGRLYGPPAEE